MLVNFNGIFKLCFCRNFSNETATKIKFTNTINLPKTKFPARVNATQRIVTEKAINLNHLANVYQWQETNLKNEEFVLHDGPPYANGDVHLGHAVNKILKDVILKRNILDRIRVHYKPGWDCHGLPIELKAIKNSEKLNNLQIREMARKFALDTVQKQKDAFASWGVTASWYNDEYIYKTTDKSYITNQLKIFYQLYKNGLIYRGLKPVFWSISSGTALAEAELEYNDNFISKSLYLRCKLTKGSLQSDKPVYALIWTTTPWTLPANQAICYNSNLKYGLVKLENDPESLYLVCLETIDSLKQEIDQEITLVHELNSNELKNIEYNHPINSNELMSFIDGAHVQVDKGTGLVHTAPAHGPDDFLVFLNKKIPLKNLVNENGCYNSSAPDFLVNKNVLSEGNDLVIEHLNSSIIKLMDYKHSYPIDWRTKEPVIVIASNQWFINTDKIKAKAIDELENVNIYPEKSSHINKTVLKAQLKKRPYWCISRQRAWGVPIPVVYDKTTQLPKVSMELVDFIASLVEQQGNIDFWWKPNFLESIPTTILEKENVEKGSDILDIWFDSGISWSHVLQNKEQIADLYLEGVDQFTGWFQSSLMTSVGMRQKAPYKNIFVHGFVVDENGKKMSKSLGNVISPKDVTKKHGTDAMRWWIAAHAVQNSSIIVSDNILEEAVQNLIKIRATLKYLLGVLNYADNVTLIENSSLSHIDKYFLHQLTIFNDKITSCYQSYQFNRVAILVNNFMNSELSSLYLHLNKDRLYCGSEAEHANLTNILSLCYRSLCKSLWPIIPFMIEESWSFYQKDGSSFYQHSTEDFQNFECGESVNYVNEALALKKNLLTTISNQNTWKLDVCVHGNCENLKLLKKLHEHFNIPTSDSELCDILQVSSLSLIDDGTTNWHISHNLTDEELCQRCRRFKTSKCVCTRCENVLKNKTL
ncbi:unnamed protein product [Diamesa serratosioi]